MILYKPVAEISGVQILLRNQNKNQIFLFFSVTSAPRGAGCAGSELGITVELKQATELIRRGGKHVFSGF